MAAPLSAAEIQKQMAANSAAWKTATPQMQTQLHQANLDLAKQTGQSYNAAQGTYSAPVSAPQAYAASAEAFKQKNWQNGGTTVTPTTGAQNLANVFNQPGNTATATPYIAGVLAQAKSATQQGSLPPTTNPAPASTPQPLSSNQTNAYTPPDYNALAAARFTASLAQKQSIANQQKSSADTAFRQQTQRTNDNRILQDFSRTQTANPFGNMGRKSFQEGLIGRERTQADADAAASLQTQKANIDQLLADYQNATADEQVRIADELQARDRQYQLDLAAQTGNLRDLTTGQTQRTIAGQTLDYNQSPNNPNNIGQVLQNTGYAQQNQLNQYKLDDYPAEQRANAEKIKREADLGKMDVETAKYNLDQLKNPNSSKNQAAKLELEMKKLDARNYPEEVRMRLQTAQKTLDQIGVVHYKPQTADEIAYDKLQVDKISQEITNLKSKGDVAPQTAETYSKYLDSVAQYTKDPDTGKNILSNPDAVESAILTSGLSEYEMFKAYKAKGLPWSGPIPTPGK